MPHPPFVPNMRYQEPGAHAARPGTSTDERNDFVVTAATLSRRLGLGLVLVLVAAAALAISPAAAGTASNVSTSCSGDLGQPFLPWLDPASYALAPGGDFEDRRSSWTLSGGAKVVSGNEPFKVTRATDAKSLSIPAGGSALSPSFCLGVGDPTLRLFAVGGNLTSTLKVEVLSTSALGTTTSMVALVPAMSSWAPTLQAPMLANVTGVTSLDGLTSSVRLRFTAMGRVGWKIDDVYVDPWKFG